MSKHDEKESCEQQLRELFKQYGVAEEDGFKIADGLLAYLRKTYNKGGSNSYETAIEEAEKAIAKIVAEKRRDITMKIYENDIDTEALGYIKGGFLAALLNDAVQNFGDDDQKREEFSEEEYEKLRYYDFTAKNISDEAVGKCVSLVDEFFGDYLNDGQKRKIDGMDREEQISFGIDLYHSMLYDNCIMDEEFRPAVNKFHPVDASASIGKSVDDDIRVFFE